MFQFGLLAPAVVAQTSNYQHPCSESFLLAVRVVSHKG